MRRSSAGTWAFLFNQEKPVPYDDILVGLRRQGFVAFEHSGFMGHPNPKNTPPGEARAKLREKWQSVGLTCEGFAGDLWGERLITAPNTDSYMGAFREILRFAEDLGIHGVRVDTTEDPWVLGDIAGEDGPPLNVDKYGGDGKPPRVGYDRALYLVYTTWRQCAIEAAEKGIRVLWEPEPGFALNAMSDIKRVLDGVNHDNFSIMADTCHAHHIAELGSRQPGKKEVLVGGISEFFRKLRGKVGRVHIIDSDGTINEHHTSTHVPLFDGVLKFNDFMPDVAASSSDDVWTIDLCFCPDAWGNLQKCKDGLDQLIRKYGL